MVCECGDVPRRQIVGGAPLWRLVPQNKAWQKELKSTWDALAEGKYDWAHLAMHLWPERVVPRCAKDRSLAIAHGLEDVFWVEGSDGKWTVRKSPTKSVDELVKERTSPAVKSALKSLHVVRLADGGSDRVCNTTALCPNCHRLFHHSPEAIEAVQLLYQKVSELVPEIPEPVNAMSGAGDG